MAGRRSIAGRTLSSACALRLSVVSKLVQARRCFSLLFVYRKEKYARCELPGLRHLQAFVGGGMRKSMWHFAWLLGRPGGVTVGQKAFINQINHRADRSYRL